MTVQNTIEEKLQNTLSPSHLEVANESHMHNVPPGSESHFKVVIVSGEFEGKMLVARHRMINSVLKDELNGQIHALALHTMTEEEWRKKQGNVADSPLCRGGSSAK